METNFLISFFDKLIYQSISMMFPLRLQIRSTLTILVTDSVVTLVTWLPHTICVTVTTHYFLNSTLTFSHDQVYTIIQMYKIKDFTCCLLMTNCFTSPVIYFCFNKAFRVSRSTSKRWFIHSCRVVFRGPCNPSGKILNTGLPTVGW